MKIIGVDNLNRDEISDILVCENITMFYANKFLEILNKNKHNSYFYKVVFDDCKLYEFEY